MLATLVGLSLLLALVGGTVTLICCLLAPRLRARQTRRHPQQTAIRQGHPVKVTGLVAQPWSMNDRAGVAFRATRIEPVVAQAKAS